MNIYFCGIGGVGLGPLAEIAVDAGHTVLGSDPTDSLMTRSLSGRGVEISKLQDGVFLRTSHAYKPIDWFVYTSALPDTHPELVLAQQLGIKTSKRDELLSTIIAEKGLKLIAVAGTHGKTTTTSLLVWALKQLKVPVSYSIGTTMSFGPSGLYDHASEYFVYECDEYDRNFLQFHPYLAIIPSISHDHPDTYPTQDDYDAAFRQFLQQSEQSILWQQTSDQLGDTANAWVLSEHDVTADLTLPGEHVRRNATLVVKALERLGIDGNVVGAINSFPGVDRRFEKLAENLYTDYAVHPNEIVATIALARELNDDVIVVYQPHQNVRQHAVRALYSNCFGQASRVYWVPTYLTREDPTLEILTPEQLYENITNKNVVQTAELNDDLWQSIQRARDRGALVLILGAGPIDGWTREKLDS